MGDDTKHLLWQLSKEGNTDELEKVVSKCERERISINVGNPERFGATAMHYGGGFSGLKQTRKFLLLN